MHTPVYQISSFDWSPLDNTFYGYVEATYCLDPDYKLPWPNGKKQFVIMNPNSGGFRRFRFKREIKEGNSLIWDYVSEDDIKVSMLVNVDTHPLDFE